jgi:hypothetical protein
VPTAVAAHSGAPPSGSQALPHVPQLAAVEYCTQDPLHMLNPSEHSTPQLPSAHVATELGSAVEHALPQAPQFCGVARLAQPASHATRPAEHPASPEASSRPVSPDVASASASPSGIAWPVASAASEPGATASEGTLVSAGPSHP